MSDNYHRPKDEWTEFVQLHGSELRDCGIPDEVIRDKRRLWTFLDHGYDEIGWMRDKHACFHSNTLTDEQIDRLASFVRDNLDRNYDVLIRSRWSRAW